MVVATRRIPARLLDEIGSLVANMRKLAASRDASLGRFLVSRHCAVPTAQFEYWYEFVMLDQEYYVLVLQLADILRERNPEFPQLLPAGEAVLGQ
ncbi:MAG: hypothetical protein R3E77_15060 [Steroidobacteraceae bacterium]